MNDEEKRKLAEDYDFLTIEAAPEEAGQILAFIHNELDAETAQHVRVPGQSRDLITFGFSTDDYGVVAEISSEYERPIWDGILVTRVPHRKLLPEEVIEFMETGSVVSHDASTTAMIDGEDDDNEDLDTDDDDEVDTKTPER